MVKCTSFESYFLAVLNSIYFWILFLLGTYSFWKYKTMCVTTSSTPQKTHCGRHLQEWQESRNPSMRKHWIGSVIFHCPYFNFCLLSRSPRDIWGWNMKFSLSLCFAKERAVIRKFFCTKCKLAKYNFANVGEGRWAKLLMGQTWHYFLTK